MVIIPSVYRKRINEFPRKMTTDDACWVVRWWESGFAGASGVREGRFGVFGGAGFVGGLGGGITEGDDRTGAFGFGEGEVGGVSAAAGEVITARAGGVAESCRPAGSSMVTPRKLAVRLASRSSMRKSVVWVGVAAGW